MGTKILTSKPWEWLVVAGILSILALVLFPVYAYSGPGINHPRVAQEIDQKHAASGYWPKDGGDLSIDRIPQGHRYSFSLEIVRPKAAFYQIEVDGRKQIWKIPRDGRATVKMVSRFD